MKRFHGLRWDDGTFDITLEEVEAPRTTKQIKNKDGREECREALLLSDENRAQNLKKYKGREKATEKYNRIWGKS